MQVSLPRRPLHWIIAGLLVFLVTPVVLVSGLFTWSPLNNWHEDIDINSGRVRHTRYLFYMEISRTIEPTWVSDAISQPLGPPTWHRVNTFSPGIYHSPHYSYHSALAQVRTFEQLQAMVPFTPAAREHLAQGLLKRWQHGSDSETADYMHEVGDAVFLRMEEGASQIDVGDLP